MNYNLDKITPDNYQRAFVFRKLGYLLCNFVLFHYKKRDFLTIYADETYSTYISKDAMHATLQNGKEIFSSEHNFSIFEAGYRTIIEECQQYIHTAKQLQRVTIADLFDLKAIIEKLYYYFEKTEFFFTDDDR